MNKLIKFKQLSAGFGRDDSQACAGAVPGHDEDDGEDARRDDACHGSGEMGNRTTKVML
jgi:hypothetical protein